MNATIKICLTTPQSPCSVDCLVDTFRTFLFHVRDLVLFLTLLASHSVLFCSLSWRSCCVGLLILNCRGVPYPMVLPQCTDRCCKDEHSCPFHFSTGTLPVVSTP